MKKSLRRILLSVILLAGILLCVVLWQRTLSLPVGYASGTTGMLSEVGVDGRNAFLLRVEEINAAGGILGRKVEPVVLDDQNTPEGVALVHQAFDARGVHFVVGHILSVLDGAVLAQATNPSKLILSASMSSALMDGIDDNFIRISSSYLGQVDRMHRYMVDTDHLQSLSIVYDLRNKAYAEGFAKAMEARFTGPVTLYGIDEDAAALAVITEQVKQNPTEGLLMLTPANVTALICQTLQTQQIDMKTYSVSWSMTNDLFKDGGRAVEGLKIVYIRTDPQYEAAYQAFHDRFVRAYGYEPSTICYNTYEITSVLFEAMRRTGSIDVGTVRAELLEGHFEGLYGSIDIDDRGDRVQRFVMFTVKDGTFVALE